MSRDHPARSFAELLAEFPDLASLAVRMDLPYQTVAAWKRRDAIPEWRWRDVARVAQALRVRGVTYTALSRAAKQRRARQDVPSHHQPAHRRSDLCPIKPRT